MGVALAMMLALSIALLLPLAAAPPRVDGLEARAQLRVCLSLEVEKPVAVDGCRRAVALGLNPDWSVAVRLYLARRLAGLMRWPEVVEVYRDLAAERPQDADAHLRLGHALLLGTAEPAQAEAAYREAARLAPQEPQAWAGLGAALNAQGRHPAAIEAFEKALQMDPEFFETHAAARVVYEAARRQEVWPPPASGSER